MQRDSQRCREGAAMIRQVSRFSAQDGRTRSLVCRVVGRRPSWLRAALLASVALATGAHAQTPIDATWLTIPPTNDFNTAGNWSGNAVPTGTATFDASSQRDIAFSLATTLGGISVTTGAGAYTLTANASVRFNGTGLSAADGASITFNTGNGGSLAFFGASTAGNSLLNNASSIVFFERSTAATAVIVNHNFLGFFDSASAGGASITSDGRIFFAGSADGGNARFNLTGGFLDISGLTTIGTGVGSLEGGGNVFLGGKLLTIGNNNLSTTFAGVIADGNADGAIPGARGRIIKF